MLILQNPSIKSEKSSAKSAQELKSKPRTKSKSTKNKPSGATKTAPISLTALEKREPALRISKRIVTHHDTKLNSIGSVSNDIKMKISKPIARKEHVTALPKTNCKKKMSIDKLLTLETRKFMDNLTKMSNTKCPYPQKSDLISLSNTNKITTSNLKSKKSKSLSFQVPPINNQTKGKRHLQNNVKSTKSKGSKNGSEVSSQTWKKNDSKKIIKDNSKLKSSLKSSTILDARSPTKQSQKNVSSVAKDKVDNEVLTGPPQFIPKDEFKQKSSLSATKQKSYVSHSHGRLTSKLISANKISSSLRKTVPNGSPLAMLPMHRKVNSLELMNKVYPRIEVTSNLSTRSGSNRTKSDLIPRKEHSDNRDQFKFKSKTIFDFKKPRSAPEPGRRISRLQRLSSSVSSKQSSVKSLNGSKISIGSLPKWQVQRLSNVAKEPDNDLIVLKSIADAAKMKHKTFTCCGGYKSIRSALESRGWIERINIYQNGYDDLTRQLYKLSINDLLRGIHDRISGVAHRRVILSKLMGSHQVDLYWDYSHDVYHGNPDSVKLTLINSIQRGVFSYATKHGLCESSKDAHWYHKPGKCHLRHPRSYSVSCSEKPEDFIKDFKVTACMSFLKWIAEMPRTKSTKLTSDLGKIDIQHFQFAMKECMKLIRTLKHEDIDRTIPESSEKDWHNFLEAYSEAVHRGNHFKTSIHETETTIVHKANVVLDKLRKCWPYCDMDGFMNIWILKPSYGSRGIGIHICRTLAYVLRILSENKNTYVIQKYIERPLLIFNTKFDIRQWFLISSTSPLTIWIYKDCYLRFSSQTYNLRKLHESIHLTNNSVQSRYHNTVNRDSSIPNYNMWDLQMFKQHLVNIGYAGVFEKVIYPGMKECITAAILMNQDHLNRRRNSFQLHGADFMLTEDFEPWLIEINARPALYSSTPITAKMCPKVLVDTIKVIIDFKENRNAPTGLFELLYKEEIEKLPTTIFDPNLFVIQGHAIRKDYFQTPEQAIAEGNLCNSRKSSEIMDITNNKNFILQVGKEMRNTLEQLLQLIHNEKNRRKILKKQLSDASTINIKKEELKELYKKEDFRGIFESVQDRSSMELKNVLYKTLSNGVLNSISNDAKQLRGMISKELGIPGTHSIDTTEKKSSDLLKEQRSFSSTLADLNAIPLSDIDEHSNDVEEIKCCKEVSVMKPTTGIFTNLLGMISNLSF